MGSPSYCLISEGRPQVRPVIKPSIPSLDLALMLEALCGPLFELVEPVNMNFLSFKTALLPTLTSALSVHFFFTVHFGWF